MLGSCTSYQQLTEPTNQLSPVKEQEIRNCHCEVPQQEDMSKNLQINIIITNISIQQGTSSDLFPMQSPSM